MELNQAEINALIKMIHYVKFECIEQESVIYATSPLINSILKKSMDLSYFSKHISSEEFNETAEKMVIDKINISQATSANKIDKKILKEVLDVALFPYITQNSSSLEERSVIVVK